ncbi:hypothetical protein P7K49_013189 [Saguinus oedipus]|uniref:Uncharacterized protein n=1 Tax=Saguinus oedipus TaxID=9490 RepID=A0ABQ9VGJ9_SAGOE|nr:hypothetical protein P7K49_013189 [Saguinus oedipus]
MRHPPCLPPGPCASSRVAATETQRSTQPHPPVSGTRQGPTAPPSRLRDKTGPNSPTLLSQGQDRAQQPHPAFRATQGPVEKHRSHQQVLASWDQAVVR